jgi:hypothetical protein
MLSAINSGCWYVSSIWSWCLSSIAGWLEMKQCSVGAFTRVYALCEIERL